MKKSLYYVLIYIMLFFPFLVLADDELVVTVDNTSFSVSQNEVTVGDTITISFAANGNTTNPLKHVQMYLTKPVTKADLYIGYFTYNELTDLYEYTLTIDDNWQNGIYYIDRIYFYDGSQSDSVYNRKNPESLGYNHVYDWNTDLSGFSFTVYGTNADDVLPTISGSTLTVSKRQVIVGDEIKYSVQVTDNVEVSKVQLQIRADEGGSSYLFKTKTIDMYYNDITGLYEGVVSFTNDDYSNRFWYVYYISARDSNSNYKYLYNQKYSSSSCYNWSSNTLSVYNYGDNPDTTLNNTSLSIDNNHVTNGDSVNISFEAMNYFGIDSVKVYLKNSDSDSVYDIDALFNKTNTTMTVNGLKYYNNEYLATKVIGEYGLNTQWFVDKIVFLSSNNKETTIYNSNCYDYENALDMSMLNFETYGLINDENIPEFISADLDREFAYLNDNVKLTVVAIDDVSGIRKVVANYTLPNGNTRDYNLTLNEGNYEYSFDYDNQNLSGKYKINYLLIEDMAGNINKITEDINNLSFNLLSPITIISPTLYPDRTTSYTLQALFADNLPTSDVVWSSSNTQIASINSQTGIMSTKNVDGKVTITATVTDGTGIYGTIDLFITNSKVRVGETTSLGTTNYVGYSSVVWEIEDESILAKTGSSGYVAINNNYRHNIGVKGLKTGITKLNMYTPSGDLLVSSNVYVYEEIKSIISETKNLTLEKGGTTTINVSALYQNDVIGNDELYYYSDNNSIIKIDQSGKITAIKGGTANVVIYSKNSNVSLTIPVTVNVYSSMINVDSDNVLLNEETQTHQIVYSLLPEDTLNKNVTFKSSNNEIVTVTDSGLIKAIRNGNATITISSEDGHSSKEILITVENLRIDINQLVYEDISKLTYTGNSIEPEFVIKDGDYYLVKGIDYTVEYSNNINVGTATALITGINNYKNSKQLEYTILQADPNIKYSSSDKTVNYNEKSHGIDFNIISPENVIVKYANSSGDYVLDEMPTYILPGQYTISYQLSINDNYTVITGSNQLIINQGQINVTASDYKGEYDGKAHTIGFDVDISGYEVEFKYSTVNYNNYFADNHTENIEEKTTNELPTFINPGYYFISYHITKENYQDVYGSYTVTISGITGYDKELLKIDGEELIVKKFVTDLNKIYFSINAVILEGGGFKHYDKNKNIVNDMIARTGDYIDYIVDDKLIATYILSIKGDLTGDGKINSGDLLQMRKYLLEEIPLTGVYREAGIIESEGNIKSLDLLRLRQYLLGEYTFK